jgi:hypothetical protein
LLRQCAIPENSVVADRPGRRTIGTHASRSESSSGPSAREISSGRGAISATIHGATNQKRSAQMSRPDAPGRSIRMRASSGHALSSSHDRCRPSARTFNDHPTLQPLWRFSFSPCGPFTSEWRYFMLDLAYVTLLDFLSRSPPLRVDGDEPLRAAVRANRRRG